MTLEVVVTSGGTISRIDDVRHIGNFSAGTTGAAIAEELLRRGCRVHYVHNRKAKRPFRRALEIDPARPLEDEVARARAVHAEFQQHAARLEEHPIETFDEYLDAVRALLTARPIDAIVLAAAVSDYGARAATGKISSDREALTIELVKLPKVISLVKRWRPTVFQVGFKLLSGAGIEEMIDVAYRHGLKNRSDLTVANSIVLGDFKRRLTVLITPEKGLTPVSVADLPARLADLILQRASGRHYRTEVVADPAWRSELAADIAGFSKSVRDLWKLNLFEPYHEGATRHFGFFARRVARGGFLITARGSDKLNLPPDDVVYVSRVAFSNRVVEAHGRKASLNANVAGRIFADRPEVAVQLHAHVFPGLERRTSVDRAPGTEEDVEEAIRHLGTGDAIELVNHGMLAVGKDLADLVAALDVEPAYTRFPELYDIVYRRFRDAQDFLRLVTRVVPRDRRVLDLAGGTGDLTERLLASGFAHVTLADRRDAMLAVARKRLGERVATHVADMRALDLPEPFDAILVRQAIGYLMDPEGLLAGLRSIRRSLRDGGVLIFNAPNPGPGLGYGDRTHAYDDAGYAVRVHEMNAVEGRILTHTQRCTLYRHDGLEIRRVYDLNRFALFTRDEFAAAAREAEFASIELFGKGLLPWTAESRSMYGVARK